jgi:hypothetical protein
VDCSRGLPVELEDIDGVVGFDCNGRAMFKSLELGPELLDVTLVDKSTRYVDELELGVLVTRKDVGKSTGEVVDGKRIEPTKSESLEITLELLGMSDETDVEVRASGVVLEELITTRVTGLELGLLVTLMIVGSMVDVVVEKRRESFKPEFPKLELSDAGTEARVSSASARLAVVLVQLLWRVFKVQHGLLVYVGYSCGSPISIGSRPCPIAWCFRQTL